MADDWQAVLKNEFSAGDGSFLIQTRIDLNWDKTAFTRLVVAMQACCEAYEGTEMLPRWLCDGFHYLSWYVESWTTHPNFPRPYEPEYYQQAYERLSDLAYWFFTGESPYLPGKGFEPL